MRRAPFLNDEEVSYGDRGACPHILSIRDETPDRSLRSEVSVESADQNFVRHRHRTPGYALLETIGLKTGKPPHTPVGDGRLASSSGLWQSTA